MTRNLWSLKIQTDHERRIRFDFLMNDGRISRLPILSNKRMARIQSKFQGTCRDGFGTNISESPLLVESSFSLDAEILAEVLLDKFDFVLGFLLLAFGGACCWRLNLVDAVPDIGDILHIIFLRFLLVVHLFQEPQSLILMLFIDFIFDCQILRRIPALVDF